MATEQSTVFSFQSTLSPTTVTASANPAASVPGTSVRYSATVAPQSGVGTPTGTVSFTVGPKTLCTATVGLGIGELRCDRCACRHRQGVRHVFR